MKPFTIVLVDDHVLIREGIKNIIDATQGLKVVAEAGDGIELLRLLDRITCDMVILDIAMPGLRGIEAAHEIRSRHPQIKVFFLSMHKSRELLSMALAAGAKGYLLKEDSSCELLHAIQEIRNGGTFLSTKMTQLFPNDIITICRGEKNAEADSLTQRERQVLKLIADGNTDRQVSEMLYISLRTVQRHRYNIRNKLNLKRTADLVRYAIAKGYTDNPV
jgi:DNA-binding NarL/FixJ family response regulator